MDFDFLGVGLILNVLFLIRIAFVGFVGFPPFQPSSLLRSLSSPSPRKQEHRQTTKNQWKNNWKQFETNKRVKIDGTQLKFMKID